MGGKSITMKFCYLLIVLLITWVLQISSANAILSPGNLLITESLQAAQLHRLVPRVASCASGSLPTTENGCKPAARGEDPFDIVVSPDGANAYVVNRSTDNLFAIDLATNQITDVIDLHGEATHPLGPAPTRLAITPDGNRLLVANLHDSSVTMIDTTSNSILQTLAVGLGPSDIAISPDGSLAYVTNQFDWTTTVIDIAATTVLTTFNVPGGGGPQAVAFAPDGERAYIVMQDAPINIIDPVTYAITGTIVVTGTNWNCDLAINGDGSIGYLAASSGNRVFVLDLVNASITDTYHLGYPQSLALSADGSRLYVGTFGFSRESDYNLWMFDTISGEVITGTNFIHPGAPRLVGSDINGLALSPDGSTLYAPSVDGESVFIVDATTLEQLDIILTNPIPGFSPFRGVISPDGSRIYIASWTQRPTTVSVIDTATQEIIGEIVASQGSLCSAASWGLGISPDGETLYVLSSGDHCVLIADTQSLKFVDGFYVPPDNESWLTSIAIHPNSEKAYVLEHAGDVHVVDLQTQSISTTISIADQCTVLKLSPDGQRGYVVCNSSFSVLDLTTDTLLKTTQISSGSSQFESLFYLEIKPDSTQYIVGAFFDLYVYETIADTQIYTTELYTQDRTWLTLGQDFAFTPDGSLGYLAMPDENAVAVFETSTWSVVEKIDTGCAPYFGTEPVWLLMDPGGNTLYVLNELSDNILVIDTASNQAIGIISLSKCHIYLPTVLR